MQSNYGNSASPGKSIQGVRDQERDTKLPDIARTLALILTAGIWSGFATAALAQSPQDDVLFARSLRSCFSPDLAAEFLARPTTPPAGPWKAALALERARAQREYAGKVGASYSTLLIESAQRELELCLQDADSKPLEPLIRFELARLAAADARLMLERQVRSGLKPSAAESKLMRVKVREAGRLLQACTPAPPSEQASALAVDEGDFAARLTLERGCNALDLASLGNSPDGVSERGAAIRRAIAQFDEVARKDSNNPLTWEAAAWLYRSHFDNDDAKSAKKVLTDLTNSKNKAAESGKRLARALRLLWLIRENDIRTQATIQAECEDWLRQFPEAYDSKEGWDLRLFLAQSAFAQVATVAAKTAISSKQREALERAWRLCTDVDMPERDEAGLARRRRLQIAKTLFPDLARPATQPIAAPQDGWLRAQFALAAMQESSEKAEPDAQRGAWTELRSLLTKVLALGEIKRFPREALECKQMLAYALFMSGELQLAADEGESLARKNPHAVAGAQAGNLALQALAALMAQEAGQTKETAKMELLRTRFLALAAFMTGTWKGHPQVDTTRHLVSLLLSREKRFAEALDQIEALSPGYAELPRALYQGASLALEARKANAQQTPGSTSHRDRAVRFLERIPLAGSGRDVKSLQIIFAGKRLLAELYLQAKQWAELERVVEETVNSFQDLEESAKAEFRVSLFALQLFAKSIGADQACRAGRYHEGRLALGPMVALVKDPASAAILEEMKQREPAVLTRFLDLSIRTAVLDEAPELAKEQLDLLARLFPENPLDLLGATMQALSDQIAALRRQGEPGKDMLEKTSGSVARFLDSLADQQKSNARPESLLFLAESYATVDQFARAGEFAARIKPPEADKSDDTRAQQVYRSARVLMLRSLRKAKDWKQAEALLDTLLAEPWGPNSLDLKKERLFLLQDQGKYAGKQGAILGWNALMMQLQPRLQDNRLREIYFDGYYQLTYCIYQNAITHSDAKAKQKDLRLAANYILKLEPQADPAAEPCKKRLQQLLAEAAPLRKEYEALKKAERQ